MSELSNKDFSYSIPSIDLLNKDASSKLNPNQDSLEKLLELYGVYVKVAGVYKGYSVTRYDLNAKPGTRLSEIYDMKDDLECQLAAGPIRIEKATPDNPIIGIEVPNEEFKRYLIKEMIESNEFKSANTTSVAIGTDNKGRTVMADLSILSHLLIGGATGSGKSMFLHSMITGILYKSSPEDVQLILVDIKGTEMEIYNGIPHLPIKPITQSKVASEMLKWAVQEMDRRRHLFEDKGVGCIEEYNKDVMSDSPLCYEKLQRIVIIIDEYADLMYDKSDIVEESICRLAQLSGHTGIHLIIATQRPSCDILTGLIKANMPSRIGFKVASKEDSITIIDQEGAECLLGMGDMLYFPQGFTKPLRLQGAFVSEDEIDSVVGYLKEVVQNTVFNNPLEEAEGFKDIKKTIENIEDDMRSLPF